MPRQTLPDFDPLSTLGIVSVERDEHTPRPARRPAAKEVPSKEPPAATTQEATASQPETAVEPPKPQGRGRAQLTLAASATAAPRAPKAKTSGRIDAELWEEVRDCVVWHGHMMTIDRFTEDAFREHLARLRKKRDLGDRFPTRESDPKQGRRVS